MIRPPVSSSSKALVVGAVLLVPGCARIEPPCFDGTYEVEFLERLPQSDCPEAWAAGWMFVVEPVSVGNRPDRCRTCSLEIKGAPPPRAVGHALGNVSLQPTIEAGIVSYVDGDDTACEAVNHLAAYIPDTGYSDVAEAAADDAMIWRVAVNGITDACGVTVPDGGNCTDYYRSRMTKIAEWTPEEGQ